jgi:hypothetical protein
MFMGKKNPKQSTTMHETVDALNKVFKVELERSI